MSEPTVPSTAKVVIIGAGIVGNCLAGHLARLGWTDMVLLDKGPLPNPGGSTGHASNFIFPVDHNKEMALLGVQSANQYRDVERSVDSGGIEVARTEERMHELQRPHDQRHGVGRRGRAADPRRGQGTGPVHRRDVIKGGFYCPTVSVVDSLDTGTLFRNEAIEKTGMQVFANTEVLDVETEDEPGHRPEEGDGRRHRQGPHRGRVRRDRLRRVVEPDRQHGRRHDPARAGRAPDGRRRPDRRARRDQQRDRLPDRPRHGHVLLRASVGRLDGGRVRTPTVRSSTTPTRSRPTRRPRSPPPRCRSPRTTSTSRWSRRSS